MHPAFLAPGSATVPIWFVNSASWRAIRSALDPKAAAFADASGFEPVPGDQDAISVRLQDDRRQFADGFLVFHNEDRFGPCEI